MPANAGRRLCYTIFHMQYQFKNFGLGIYGTYKPAGITPLQAIEIVKENNPELQLAPLTYAGRLDPMAEGLLLLLDSSIIKNKEDFLKLDKTYEAEILFGIQTDSFDLLGLPRLDDHFEQSEESERFNKISNPSFYSGSKITQEKILEALQSFLGPVTMPLPPYSSPPFNGKPLFVHAQQGSIHEANTPVRTTTIYNISLNNIRAAQSATILQHIRQTVPKIKGDFRIPEIMTAWEELLKNDGIFTFADITIHASHGTYIRSLANELGKSLKSGACIYRLKRTRVGNYELG